METLLERFWEKVGIDDEDQCWLWTAGVNGGGYGVLKVDGKTKSAHRVAYQLAIGPIPDGLEVLHICENHPCCNPKHLFTGVQQVRGLSLEESFWRKVNIGAEDECWLWQAAHNEDGYGNFKFCGESKKAHRVAYELSNGPIPDGLDVLHTCDHPPCVNPKHLFTGTHQDNMTDKVNKGRQVFLWGATNPSTKLTTEQVEEAVRLHESGQFTLAEIGEMLNVHQATISRICRGESRQHG